MKEVTFTRYIAGDGTMFKTEQECRDYEEQNMPERIISAIHLMDERERLIPLIEDDYKTPLHFAASAVHAVYAVLDNDAAAMWASIAMRDNGIMNFPQTSGRFYFDGDYWIDIDDELSRLEAIESVFDRFGIAIVDKK